MKLSKFAPALFVLFWSTGFIGAKFGLPYADPLIFLAVRVLFAAIILLLVANILKLPLVRDRSSILISAMIGFFLHACYLGGVFFAISKGLPASVAAVVTSLQPILVSILAMGLLKERITFRQVIAMFIGLIGVLLVLAPSVSAAIGFSAFVGIFVALIGSTVATLLQKKFGSDIPLIAGSAYQYIFSGIFLAFLAFVTGERHIQWSKEFIFAFFWLVLVLSVGAILILLWLIKHSTVASVSSLLYLVPPATAVEAYLIFGEKINTQGAIGIALCALGVWLVIKSSVKFL